MSVSRLLHTASLLHDGRVLVVGGTNSPNHMASAELYGAAAPLGVACVDDGECLGSQCIDEVCCDTQCGGGDTGDCRACSLAFGAPSDGECALVTSGHVCREGTGDACDPSEACNGSSTVCPADVVAGSGTVCRVG